MFIRRRQLVRNRKYWTNILASHACNVTNFVERNRIKLTRESCGLRTYRYACAAVDASVPIEVEDDGGVLFQKNW